MLKELIIAGFGGQGVLSMGMLLTCAGMAEGKEISWLPSYGPEMRGGTSSCCVVISDEPVGAPLVTEADCVMAMNRPSLSKYESAVKPGGILIINSSIIDKKAARTDINVYYVPCNEIAAEIGNSKVMNMVMLGAYLELSRIVDMESVLNAFPEVLGKGKEKLIPINREALLAGARAVE